MFSWPELFSDKGVDDVVRFADFFSCFFFSYECRFESLSTSDFVNLQPYVMHGSPRQLEKEKGGGGRGGRESGEG